MVRSNEPDGSRSRSAKHRALSKSGPRIHECAAGPSTPRKLKCVAMLYLSPSCVCRSYYLHFGARIEADAQEWEERLRRYFPIDKQPKKDPQLERHIFRQMMKQEFPLANL